MAVYETPGNTGWEEERVELYEAFEDFAKKIEGARFFTGAEVTATRFRAKCESAKIMHFLGHCNSSAGNTKQHLTLAATSQDEDAVDQPQAATAENHTNSEYKVPTTPLTMSNLFTIPIRAIHFNLIACGSMSQVISSSDEPWGIVTVLLCAGATSIKGTI